MPNESHIILPNKTPPKFPKRQVATVNGELMLRCNNCGGFDWTIIVRPRMEHGDATIASVTCKGCVRAHKVEEGLVGGSRTNMSGGKPNGE